MRSQELRLDRYETDKVSNGYLHYYDAALADLVHQEVRLLEIGVLNGGSLRLWRDYFSKGTVTGIDLQLPANLQQEERIQVFEGSQSDTAFLTHVASMVAPAGFDVIIDDASHVGGLTKTSFWHLFDNHLKPSGLYIIEDWGTGYWDDWPDGRAVRRPSQLRALRQRVRTRADGHKSPWPTHSYGMVGLIKELIDEQGAGDVTRGNLRGTPKRSSKFQSVLVTPSIVFVKKAALADVWGT